MSFNLDYGIDRVLGQIEVASGGTVVIGDLPVVTLRLQANIDESGKFHDKDAICLCGFITRPSIWMQFNVRWMDLLKKWQIPHLHIGALMRWDAPYDAKQKKWGNVERDEVIRQFSEVIADTLGGGYGLSVGVAFDSRHFRTLTSEDQRRLGKPNHFVFDLFIRYLLAANSFSLVEKDYGFSLVCDDDQESSMEYYKLLCKVKIQNEDARKRITGICFFKADFNPALQAADLLAYETLREMKKEMASPGAIASPVFTTIAKSTGFRGVLFKQKEIDDLAAAWPIETWKFVAGLPPATIIGNAE